MNLDIDDLRRRATEGVAAAATLDELQALRGDLLGKRSALAEAKRALGGLAPDERKQWGQRINEAMREVEATLEARRDELGPGRPPDPTQRRAPRSHRTHRPSSPWPSAPRVADLGTARGRVRRARLSRGRGSRDRDRLAQLRGAQHAAGPSRHEACGTRSTSNGVRPAAPCCARTPRRCRSA